MVKKIFNGLACYKVRFNWFISPCTEASKVESVKNIVNLMIFQINVTRSKGLNCLGLFMALSVKIMIKKEMDIRRRGEGRINLHNSANEKITRLENLC